VATPLAEVFPIIITWRLVRPAPLSCIVGEADSPAEPPEVIAHDLFARFALLSVLSVACPYLVLPLSVLLP
jgi:hypothetical protein